jgi:putative resolvase
MKDDIVRDLHEVIVLLCARLYGKRSAKNRAKRTVAVATGQ